MQFVEACDTEKIVALHIWIQRENKQRNWSDWYLEQQRDKTRDPNYLGIVAVNFAAMKTEKGSGEVTPVIII